MVARGESNEGKAKPLPMILRYGPRIGVVAGRNGAENMVSYESNDGY
jgi:hypothetical protein